MAISAYIFIETTQGKARGITREILQIPGVQSAHSVIPGVLRTLTNVVIDEK